MMFFRQNFVYIMESGDTLKPTVSLFKIVQILPFKVDNVETGFDFFPIGFIIIYFWLVNCSLAVIIHSLRYLADFICLK